LATNENRVLVDVFETGEYYKDQIMCNGYSYCINNF